MIKPKKFIVLIVIFFFINIFILTINIGSLPISNSSTLFIYVDSSNVNGPWDGSINYPYRTIKDAYEICSNGDTILVKSGVYKESINIMKKSILIKGLNKKDTIIQSENNQYIFSILNKNVKIKDLTFCYSGANIDNHAISILNENVIIKNCIFHHTNTAILIYKSKYCTISDCIFYQNGDGISLIQTEYINIENCTFTHNSIGIHEESTRFSKINDCYNTVNGIGIFLNNSQKNTITKSAFFNNNDNQGGIFLDSCYQITIYNCIIEHNGFGMKTRLCESIGVFNSNFRYNTHSGFFIGDESRDIRINSCLFSKNLRFSIYGDNSQFKVTKSNFVSTIYALYSENSKFEAKNNWWESSLGPSKYELNNRERVSFDKGFLPYIPWNTSMINYAGANWYIDLERIDLNVNFTVNQTIIFNEPDDDKDGVPNWWEEKYDYDSKLKQNHYILDPDNDGLTNIQECYTYKWNSNPYKKDIFLEFDWMESKTPGVINKPSQSYINQIIESFEEQDITLHVDTGNLDGGEIIPYKYDFTYAELQDYYWNYFLHNDMNNPRKGIFHYSIVCDYGPGPGFAFIGWDHLDSFCISADWLDDNQNLFDRALLIIGGSIHELGHTLGLTVDDHGGNDNTIATMILNKQWFKYLPYKSCMNYWYTYKVLTFSDGSRGPNDFNDWEHMDFSFFKSTHFNLPDKYR